MSTDNINTGSWERIQNGFQDTERLLGQKRYNECMIRARQTLEFMVKCLCERFDIMEASLVDMIDALYENEIISKTTCEHYHKIRIIGNKAVHEEDNLAYNAGQAYHLLSQEIYTFANDFTGKKKRQPSRQREDGPREAREDGASRDTRSRASRGGSPARGSSARAAGSGTARRRRARSSGPNIDPASLLKILIPVAVIIILIFIIRLVNPGDKDTAETTAPIQVETIAPETEAITEAPSEESQAPAKRYRTSDTLNVRSEPSTSASKLGQLAPGTEVEFLEDHDDTWAKIAFEGKEGYVSKEYLELIAD